MTTYVATLFFAEVHGLGFLLTALLFRDGRKADFAFVAADPIGVRLSPMFIDNKWTGGGEQQREGRKPASRVRARHAEGADGGLGRGGGHQRCQLPRCELSCVSQGVVSRQHSGTHRKYKQ